MLGRRQPAHYAEAMKTLILIRHAKSDRDDVAARDYDRTLNRRGRRDASEMGLCLFERKLLPDMFTASSAVRARMTAELMADAMGYPEEQLQWRHELYLASPATMMKVVRNTLEAVTTLALLAHNPGITELGEQLSGRAIDNIPTAGMVILTADIACWQDVGYHWQLQDFDYPKRLH